MEREKLEISWASLWRVFIILVFTVAIFMIRDVLAILFLAIVISSALDGPVSFFEKKGVPRILGAIFIFLSALVVLALVLYTIIPVSIVELNSLLANLNNNNLPILSSFNFSSWVKNIDKTLGAFADQLFSGGLSFISFIGSVFGNILLIVTTFVVSFYLTIRRDGVEDFLGAITPVTHEHYVIDVFSRVRKKLGRWLQAQVILMVTVGFLVFLGLWLLDVKYSLVLGILTGMLEIVPIAGPIFAGGLAFVSGVSESLLLGVYSVILFVVVHQIESNILVPVIMKKAIGISPVVVVVAILAGLQIAGFVGMILSVPVALVFQELLADWEKKKLRVRGNRFEI